MTMFESFNLLGYLADQNFCRLSPVACRLSPVACRLSPVACRLTTHHSPLMITLRVYGILIDPSKRVLVSDEHIRGKFITKFPGGGLEIGEGTRDCLKREFIEEMNLEVEVLEHIYTTDFYQQSAFNPADQIVSIYYYVKALAEIKVPLRDKPFDFDEQQNETYKKKSEIETFRFIDWNDFSADTVSLPIDKIVATIVKNSATS
jgi:8-oxo-dGTP diphosphatase